MSSDDYLALLLSGLEPDEVEGLVGDLPDSAVSVLAEVLEASGASGPASPLDTALTVDPGYQVRAHLQVVSDTLSEAVADVERGVSRYLIIEMPPRTGKTMLTTLFAPLWILRRHADWNLALTSHDPTLATSWGRQVRRWVEAGAAGPTIQIAPDAGAAGEWETTAGGGVLSRSLRGSFTGRGAKVLLIDDPHKDFVEAHSKVERDRIWNWWLTVAQTRLEPPALVIVIMTRWHEDDLVGRLLSTETEGDPGQWTRIRLPAISDGEEDALGRPEGEPLYSPLLEETREEALERWAATKRSVGTYAWSALFQQRPAPAGGSIFNDDWWRYWTTDPARVTDDGRVVLLDPDSAEVITTGQWVESWDMAFKGTDSSDYVVGQRWVRYGERRFLTGQHRARLSFTETLRAFRLFHAAHVPIRLVEDKANGTAVIDTLRAQIGGIVPVSPRDGKEARARAVSPDVEGGHVYLPHPEDPGHEWVRELLSELRNFPNDVHDDQVDALTQALTRLRGQQAATVTAPSSTGRSMPRRATAGRRLASSPAASVRRAGGR